MTIFVQHAAAYQVELPPGSLAALQASLEAGLDWIEVDIIPLRGGDFALLHDPELSHSTESSGKVSEKTAAELQDLQYLQKGSNPQKLHLGTLTQAIHLMKAKRSNGNLQLDLKPYAPLAPSILHNLLQIVHPVKEQILISCVADWAIRYLRDMDAEIRLGFDPLLYLDVTSSEPRPAGVPPLRKGAFGYLDDHPLALERWGSLGEYFSARAEALFTQTPPGSTWYLNASLLDDSLQAGFDWPGYLHHRGSQVDAWTIDMDRLVLAERMISAQVDMITSNQPRALQSHLQTGQLTDKDQ